MIKGIIKGDILSSQHKHIAFAINAEGYNDAGFAGLISAKFWPELANTGPQELGTVLIHKTPSKTFYGLVCHSLKSQGWKDTPKLAKQCLDSIDIPEKETLAVVKIGAGLIGQMSGANPEAILREIENSKHDVEVFYL